MPGTDLDDVATEPDTYDEVPEPKSVTFIDYNDPFSFVEQSYGAPHVQKLSSYAWVGCGGDVYVLECLGKGFIRVEPVQDKNGGFCTLILHECSLTHYQIRRFISKLTTHRQL